MYQQAHQLLIGVGQTHTNGNSMLYNFFPNCNARELAFFVMFGRDPINKLNMLLHSARRYFHDDNGLPNLEALKNIYKVVAQQLLNSRERYVKKHHNQQ